MKDILVIEDKPEILDLIKRRLEKKGFRVACAKSIEEAIEIFPTKQWDAIAIDGCIEGDDFNSPPLIREFKEKCKPGCIIMAMSSSRDLVEQMVKIGCTEKALRKEHVPDLLEELLEP